MNVEEVKSLLAEFEVDRTIEDSKLGYFNESLEQLRDEPRFFETSRTDTSIASMIERFALDATEGDAKRSAELFDDAFLARRSADTSNLDAVDLSAHYVCLCSDGLHSERRAELIMLLRQSELDDLLLVPEGLGWADELLLRIGRAFVLLCRKSGGWKDIHAAVEEIDALRQLQRQKQAQVLEAARRDRRVAGDLVARFNLAKIVDLVGHYTIRGEPSDATIQLERHLSNVHEILQLQPDPQLLHLADMLGTGCMELLKSSIWYTTRRLGSQVRRFVDHLTAATREQPILELWPSQRAALGASLLDPAKRAIVVEMPTSAGKTLIAEFAILQALALNPGSKVAYVVPTRALVNQVVLRLRADFAPSGYSVEAAVPVFELDPTEDQLLRSRVDILVVTPEKLDLLVKSAHPAAESIALVVADEAHNIAEGERGARFELLLGTIKRERADARFLLLTPFVPNSKTLAAWLGDDEEGTIQVSWRPSERLTAAAIWRKPKSRPYELVLRTLPSAQNVDLESEIELPLGPVAAEGARSKERISVSTAVRLARRGGVLVLTRGRGSAEKRAGQVASNMEERQLSTFGESVVRYVQSELGVNHELSAMLRRGVTYHHAGLSHDVRFLLELLIDREDVRVVCGTTTLAQGVNFPIASVIVETLKKPQGIGRPWAELTYSEFWNIAGRAGRALRDRLGLVVFPAKDNKDVDEIRAFLRGEAAELVSVLLGAFEQLSSTAVDLNLAFVRQNKELAVFLQYLTHALRVAGADSAAAEIDDMLRSSLVYHQARRVNRRAAENVVRLARRYFEEIRGRDTGFISLADGTGFSLYSVDYMYARYREQHPEFADIDFWRPDNLFSGDTEALASVVSLLSDVPELTLGQPGGGVFNAQRVAGIVTDWVNGRTVADIADAWFSHVEDPVERHRDAGHYLYSQLMGQVPWGVGALQLLALSGQSSASDVGYVPSLIFYGVSTKEASAMRMASVPRAAAEGLGAEWRNSAVNAVASYEQLRGWVLSRSLAEWSSALPDASPMTGADCRDVWSALSGLGVNDDNR